MQRLDVGTIPRSLVVVLEDDLVDKCKPGDDVTVTGVVLRRWQNFYQDVSVWISFLHYLFVCAYVRYKGVIQC